MSSKQMRNAGGLSGRKIITIIGILCVVALIAEVALLAGIFRKKGNSGKKKAAVTNTPTVTETVSEPTPTEEPEEGIQEGYVQIWKPVRSIEYNNMDFSAEKTYRYDEAGNEILSELRFKSGNYEKSEGTYDASRQKIAGRETRTSGGDTYIREIRYQYDEHGNFRDIMDGMEHNWYVTEYDEKGRKIYRALYECIAEDTDGDGLGDREDPQNAELLCEETWKYDGEDLIDYYWRDEKVSISTREVYSYNHATGEYTKTEYWSEELDRIVFYRSDGNIDHVVWASYDGTQYTRSVYEYNAQGLSVKRTDYLQDGEVSEVTTWEYDAYGREIRNIEKQLADNYVTTRTKTYDDDGNVILEEVYNNDDLNTRTEREYDEFGNCVRDTMLWYYIGEEELYVTEAEFVSFTVPYELLSEDEIEEVKKREARIPKK